MSTVCPFASYRPVQNHGAAMSGHLGLVLHVQQGNGSLYGYFNNPASEVSAHFWVAKDGTLEQYVDCDVVAWAEAAGNPNYLSVETEGFDTEPLNATQVAVLGDLLAWAAAKYNFPTTGPTAHGQKGFTQHCNPNGTPDPTWGDHTCPGTIRLGQMSAVTAAAQPIPDPTTGVDPDMITSFERADGSIVTYLIAPGDSHVIEMVRKPGAAGFPATSQNTSLIDITSAFPAQVPA